MKYTIDYRQDEYRRFTCEARTPDEAIHMWHNGHGQDEFVHADSPVMLAYTAHPEPKVYRFMVEVLADSEEHARQVMAERTDYDEQYEDSDGNEFYYQFTTVTMMPTPEDVPAYDLGRSSAD